MVLGIIDKPPLQSNLRVIIEGGTKPQSAYRIECSSFVVLGISVRGIRNHQIGFKVRNFGVLGTNTYYSYTKNIIYRKFITFIKDQLV